MHTATLEESPLTQPTFAHVSRNLSVPDLQQIVLDRELPPAWKGQSHLELAHHLYWKEQDSKS